MFAEIRVTAGRTGIYVVDGGAEKMV